MIQDRDAAKFASVLHNLQIALHARLRGHRLRHSRCLLDVKDHLRPHFRYEAALSSPPTALPEMRL